MNAARWTRCFAIASMAPICAALPVGRRRCALFEQHRVPLVLYNRTSPSCAGGFGSVSCDSTAGRTGACWAAAGGASPAFRRDQRAQRIRLWARSAVPRCAGYAGAAQGITRCSRGRAAISAMRAACEGCRRLMEEACARFDAIVCANDLHGHRRHRCLPARNSACARPQDISVVGFDGSGPATWASYRVTSIRQPVKQDDGGGGRPCCLERIEDPKTPAGAPLVLGRIHFWRVCTASEVIAAEPPWRAHSNASDHAPACPYDPVSIPFPLVIKPPGRAGNSGTCGAISIRLSASAGRLADVHSKVARVRSTCGRR